MEKEHVHYLHSMGQSKQEFANMNSKYWLPFIHSPCPTYSLAGGGKGHGLAVRDPCPPVLVELSNQATKVGHFREAEVGHVLPWLPPSQSL